MKNLSRFTALFLSAGIITSMTFSCYDLSAAPGIIALNDSSYYDDPFADNSVIDYSDYNYATDYTYDASYDPYASTQGVVYDESVYSDGETNAYGYYYTDGGTVSDEKEESDSDEDLATFEKNTSSEEDEATDEAADEAAEEESEEKKSGYPESWPPAPEITATSAYIIDSVTGTVIYSKNPDEVLEMSGLTKIMTSLVALENSKLDDPITVTATGASAVYMDSSNIALKEGEVVTVEDCIAGMMLASANDAALQIAETLGDGSIDNFLKKMNEKAAELGCTNTNFLSASGLPQDLAHIQYSTAHDVALITKAAFDNEDFRRIASSVSYSMEKNDTHEARAILNNFSLSNPDNYFYYENCIGGRDAYSTDATLSVACAAASDNKRFIIVAMDGGDTDNDALLLSQYAFNSCQVAHIAENATEGGWAVFPAFSSIGNVKVSPKQTIEGSHQEYYFDGFLVGTGFIPYEEKEVINTPTPTPAINHEDNIKAAEEITSTKSEIPYYVIGAVTGILLILLLVLLIKVIRKK